VEALYRMLSASNPIEPCGVSWSDDEAYVAFSFPRRVYMMAQFGMNVWLSDVQEGLTFPVVPEVPPVVSLAHDDISKGLPARAAFERGGNTLIYEMYRMDPGLCGYFRFDPRTRESETAYFYSVEYVSGDPSIWPDAGGLTMAVASTRSGGDAGVVTLKQNAPLRAAMPHVDTVAYALARAVRITDIRQGKAMLFSDCGYNFGEASRLLAGVTLLDLETMDTADFNDLIVISPELDASKRLARYSAQAMTSEVQLGEILVMLDIGQIIRPHNAVFSPDGNYALLTGRLQDKLGGRQLDKPVVYVWNLVTNECGEVNLDALGIDDAVLLGTFYNPVNRFGRGIQWAGDGKLLIDVDGQPRMYTLGM